MTSATAELRRRARAAAILYRYPTAAARLEDRHAAALAQLAAVLGPADSATVPGYRVARTVDGIAVTPQAPTHADQLKLWSAAA